MEFNIPFSLVWGKSIPLGFYLYFSGVPWLMPRSITARGHFTLNNFMSSGNVIYRSIEPIDEKLNFNLHILYLGTSL